MTSREMRFLSVGDVVRLKSQPERQMTVRRLVEQDTRVECVWHDNEGWHFEFFDRQSLVFVRSGMSPDA